MRNGSKSLEILSRVRRRSQRTSQHYGLKKPTRANGLIFNNGQYVNVASYFIVPADSAATAAAAAASAASAASGAASTAPAATQHAAAAAFAAAPATTATDTLSGGSGGSGDVIVDDAALIYHQPFDDLVEVDNPSHMNALVQACRYGHLPFVKWLTTNSAESPQNLYGTLSGELGSFGVGGRGEGGGIGGGEGGEGGAPRGIGGHHDQGGTSKS